MVQIFRWGTQEIPRGGPLFPGPGCWSMAFPPWNLKAVLRTRWGAMMLSLKKISVPAQGNHQEEDVSQMMTTISSHPKSVCEGFFRKKDEHCSSLNQVTNRDG